MSRRVHLCAGLAVLGLVAGLTAGCQGEKTGSAAAPAGRATVAAVPAAEVTIAPGDGSTKVRLDKAITVGVAQGTLTEVSVTTKSGKALKGKLSADRTSWQNTAAPLGGTKYSVTVTAADQANKSTQTTASFTTLKPKDTGSVWMTPSSDWTVGVGMPVIVNFTEPVATKSRSTVEKALAVDSSKGVDGAWRWFSSEQVQWRPKTYWPANTKVKVTADLAGVELSPGVWGTKKTTTAFKVGDAVISTVDVDAHTLTMRRNGKVVRTIPVTTGKASMATRNGIKVIMSRETAHRMRSESIGIGKDDPDYYDIVARYAMRLTNSGEFLHAAPWSTGSQGRVNVSHGCTGMSTANAQWLFNKSKVGDVVVYKNSARKLEWGNGYTAWNKSFSSWSNA